jgi:hypothetical protein
MAWSFAGLLAAAAAELVTRAPLSGGLVRDGRSGMLVGFACVAVFLGLGSIVIPRLQDARSPALASADRHVIRRT